ncbi:MAG TPA: tetratricopeptide repeat protein [Vicinamibacteria bacterium]|nr:tetratricopeptide repeat protein [Vicinamibacteria bacterium]
MNNSEMTDTPYNETLGRFKKSETVDAVLIVGDDGELVRLLLAWRNARPQPRRYISAPKGDEWRWLWDNTDFSTNDLIASSGLSRDTFEKKWAVLTGNRIVYPDGTIHSQVARSLQERAHEVLGQEAEPSHSFETFESAWEAGHEAINQGSFSKAIATFEAAMPLACDDPQRADALHFIAWSLMQQGKHTNGREVLARTFELRGARPDQICAAYHLTAHSFIDEGKSHLSDAWFEKIIEMDEDAEPAPLCEAFVARGYTLSSKKQYPAARQAFADCMEVVGGMSIHKGSARFHTGLTFCDEGNYAEARKHFEAFLEMKNVYPEELERAKKNLDELKKHL